MSGLRNQDAELCLNYHRLKYLSR